MAASENGGNGAEHRAAIHFSFTQAPTSHTEFTFSIWPRPPVLTQVSEGRMNTKLCVVATSLRDVPQYVAESLTVVFPRSTQASSTGEEKGSCHSPQHQLEKPLQCVKSVSGESLGDKEGKKLHHCNGTLPCLSVCLSVSKDFWVNKYQSERTIPADLQSSLHLWRK